MPTTVLICPKALDHTPGEHFDLLASKNFFIRYAKPMKDLLTAEELSANLDGVDAVVAGSEPYTREVIRRFPNLRVISRVGVGYDSVDVEAATEQGIAVAITPGTNHDSVAELTFALLLAVAKRIASFHPMVAAGGFERKITKPLRGQTLGLVGYGRIGQAVARRAIAFGMKVIAADPLAAPTGDSGVETVSFDQLLGRSDIISLHAPANSETHHLIRGATIKKMRRGVVILNTARGSLIDEQALAQGLASGQVGGAGLDVFEQEPPTGSQILSAPRVVLTPHVAGIDEEGVRQMAVMACRTVVDLFSGEWPTERIVNASELGSWTWTR